MSYYTEKYSILNHDTDSRELLRPSCLMKYMQETANHQMRDCKPSYTELFEQGKAFIVSRMAFTQSRPIAQYEDIEVATWPSEKDWGATFTRCYTVSAGGEEVARAVGVWALVDIPTKKLLRVSDVDLSNYTHGEPFELKELRFRMPKEGMERAGEFNVHYFLCDCNMHMNNTNYGDMFFSYLPQPQTSLLKSMSITYKKEARLDARLIIERSQGQKNNDGTVTYFFRSYTEDRINAEAMLTVAVI